jgi:ribulose-5-phosphate 4-epimerase/fuculose-1-phosphate aldolase
MDGGRTIGASVREGVSPAEWETRVKLAACYRLVERYGMSDMIYTHISARVPGDHHHFLINPYGLLYREITASSLIKIDLQGNIVHRPEAAMGCDVNQAGFVIHSAVHAARPEAQCVLHTHTRAGMTVSTMRCGLLPLTQHAMRFHGRIGYHDYEGPAVDMDERSRLVADLGPHDAMILRNHGLLTCGRTVAEAFQAMYLLETSCRTQILAQSGGGELVQLSQSMIDLNREQAKAAMKGKGANLVWPGLLRRLDRRNPGYDI